MPFYSRFINGGLKIARSFGDVLSASHLVSYLRPIWPTTNLLAFGMSSFFKERVWEWISLTQTFADKGIVQSLGRFFSAYLKDGWCIPCYFQRAKQQICRRVSVLMRFENFIWWLQNRFCTERLGARPLWEALRGSVCKIGWYEGSGLWPNTKNVQ